VGTGTELEVAFNVLAGGEPLVARGRVIGKRTARGAVLGTPGLWVRLDPDDAASLRRDLEGRQAKALYMTLRRVPRFRRTLRVLLGERCAHVLSTVNISETGACLSGLLPWPIYSAIPVVIDFGEVRVRAAARVRWKDEMHRTTGVELLFAKEAERLAMLKELAAIAGEESGRPPSRTAVLAASTDAVVMAAIATAVHARGYPTVMASTGPEALAIARRVRPALAVLDRDLSGMSGVEVCRALKSDAETRAIPVVLIGDPREPLPACGAFATLPRTALEPLAALVAQPEVVVAV
jgi:CheY-like chemotaxis protein